MVRSEEKTPVGDEAQEAAASQDVAQAQADAAAEANPNIGPDATLVEDDASTDPASLPEWNVDTHGPLPSDKKGQYRVVGSGVESEGDGLGPAVDASTE